VYARYSLPELTAHLVALLERRRAAFDRWSPQAEDALTQDAEAALTEAHAGFVELADDPAYWQRTRATLLTVALPRYVKLARAQHALERSAYGAWRAGDLLSRVAYAATGLVLGIVVVKTAIPDWLEPLPIALFLGGPLLPDLQAWWAKRRYAKALVTLVDDMAQEEKDARQYQALGIAPVGSDEPAALSPKATSRE
jgi:hypothetical protein